LRLRTFRVSVDTETLNLLVWRETQTKPFGSRGLPIYLLGLVRLFPIHMDWMRLKKILKKFNLFGIQTHPTPLNPHRLKANRTSPYMYVRYN
jgi:hypothetical protein